MDPQGWRLLADAVLVAHAGVVLFVVGGLVAIVAGDLFGRRGVDRLAFRVVHLAAIAVVVAQAWLGRACPLTVLEARLRERAGQAVHGDGFVEHWVGRLLFWDAPSWVFVVAYTAFAAAVLAAWWRWPPTRPQRGLSRRIAPSGESVSR